MFNSIAKLLRIFTRAERRRFVGVVAAMLAMGVLQLASVGVVLPFVSLLSNPGRIHDNAFLELVYEMLGFASTNSFLLFVGALLLVILVASNVFTATMLWVITFFAWGVQERLSERLLSGYLRQPYESFLNRNSADIGKNILIESQQFTTGVLMPALQVIAFGITAILIVGFLIWLNPLAAIGVGTIFGCAYILVYLTVRRSLERIGAERLHVNTRRFKAVSEAFGSIKEVKVLGREDAFLKRYEPAASIFAAANAKNQVISQFPRYVIESLAFGMVMVVLLYLISKGEGIQSALPIASAFVLAGYRLLPALQQIYQGFARWRFNQPVLNTIWKDLTVNGPNLEMSVSAASANGDEPSHTAERQKISFEKSIELRNVGYRYPNAERTSLHAITMTIPRNSFVALTGPTGAGKTTLADLILGLLQPSEGEISVDETLLTPSNRSRWQASLGYVPQDIYLTDNSIASNIAYGIDDRLIDSAAVERAARVANIHDFICHKLPDGYETIVGERGVRLSGGQRQRIGIARALYHDPQVIVLDEATSALDNETERRIVNELDAMRGGRTLIVIAHRLTTVRKCNKVFLLRDGAIAASGSYEELLNESRFFNQLAQTDGQDVSSTAVG